MIHDQLNEPYKFEEFDGLRNEIGIGLINGTQAMSDVRLIMIFDLKSIINVSETFNDSLFDLVHISEDNGGLEPCFLFISDISEEWLISGVNSM